MNNNIQILLKYPQVIQFFLDHPNDGSTPNELSRVTKISYPTMWRYLRALHRMGIVSLTKIGRYNLYKLNENSEIKKKLGDLVDIETTIKDYLLLSKK